jgi:hypothetical protein
MFSIRLLMNACSEGGPAEAEIRLPWIAEGKFYSNQADNAREMLAVQAC